MKVIVLGTGNMGSAFVKQLTRAGHSVAVTGRNLKKAKAVAAGNAGATAFATTEGAPQADAVILATGYGDAAGALKSLGNLDGKVVIDITNPLTPDYMDLT